MTGSTARSAFFRKRRKEASRRNSRNYFRLWRGGPKMMDKEVSEKMMEACRSLAKMLELSYQGFRMAAEEPIREAEEAGKEVRRRSSELTNFLISRRMSGQKEREWAKPLLSVASIFDRMSYNLEGIVDRLKGMNRERIFFSDRGSKEVN